jgi:hypothetical protein
MVVLTSATESVPPLLDEVATYPITRFLVPDTALKALTAVVRSVSSLVEAVRMPLLVLAMTLI